MEAKQPSTIKPFMLYDGERYKRIEPNEIAYLEADHMKCYVHMCDGQTSYTLSAPLGNIEPLLPSDIFVRIHRRYIINIWHVQLVMGRLVRLDMGKSLTLGETYGRALENQFIVLGEKRK